MITLRHTAAQINTAPWCQGSVFSHAVYGQLGRLEVADTLTVIRELLRGHKYIDPDRWSLCICNVSYIWTMSGFVSGAGATAGSWQPASWRTEPPAGATQTPK